MDSQAGEAENALVLSFALILWVFCANKNSSIFLFLFVSHINIFRETEIKKKNTEPHGFKAETNSLKVQSLTRSHVRTELHPCLQININVDQRNNKKSPDQKSTLAFSKNLPQGMALCPYGVGNQRITVQTPSRQIRFLPALSQCQKFKFRDQNPWFKELASRVLDYYCKTIPGGGVIHETLWIHYNFSRNQLL